MAMKTPSYGIDQSNGHTTTGNRFIDKYWGRCPMFLHKIPEADIWVCNPEYMYLMEMVFFEAEEVRPHISMELFNEIQSVLFHIDSIAKAPTYIQKILYCFMMELVHPIADAGPDQSGRVNTMFIMDGSGSTPGEHGNTLTYMWKVYGKPAGSNPIFSETNTVSAKIVTDRTGIYKIELVVHDGYLHSLPDYMYIRSFGAYCRKLVVSKDRYFRTTDGEVTLCGYEKKMGNCRHVMVKGFRLIMKGDQWFSACSGEDLVCGYINVTDGRLVMNNHRFKTCKSSVQPSQCPVYTMQYSRIKLQGTESRFMPYVTLHTCGTDMSSRSRLITSRDFDVNTKTHEMITVRTSNHIVYEKSDCSRFMDVMHRQVILDKMRLHLCGIYVPPVMSTCSKFITVNGRYVSFNGATVHFCDTITMFQPTLFAGI